MRLKSIEIRKDLTDEWETRGVKEEIEFAILTNEITKAWTGMTAKEYKGLNNLKKENLRDNTCPQMLKHQLLQAGDQYGIGVKYVSGNGHNRNF